VRGVGAFAARGLAEGEVIGEYAGEIVRDAELAGGARRGSQYVFDLGDGLAVDARAVRARWPGALKIMPLRASPAANRFCMGASVCWARRA
jgi:hypothetical protein